MTVNEMKSQLADRVEDADDVIIDADVKIDFLQNAQIELAMLLDNNYLTDIENIQESVDATAGVIDISDLEYSVFKGKNGILVVKIHDESYCFLIDYSELKGRDSYFSGGRQYPYAYVFQNKIYIENGQTNPVADVWYLRHPTSLVEDGNCDLDSSLHDLIVMLAEEPCWRINNQPERGATSRNIAIDRINNLNAIYKKD